MTTLEYSTMIPPCTPTHHTLWGGAILGQSEITKDTPMVPQSHTSHNLGPIYLAQFSLHCMAQLHIAFLMPHDLHKTRLVFQHSRHPHMPPATPKEQAPIRADACMVLPHKYTNKLCNITLIIESMCIWQWFMHLAPYGSNMPQLLKITRSEAYFNQGGVTTCCNYIQSLNHDQSMITCLELIH